MEKTKAIWTAIFITVTGSIVTKVLADEIEFSRIIAVYIGISLGGLLVFFVFVHRRDMLILFNSHFSKKIKIKQIRGFFGREEVIKNILNYHRSSIGVLNGIIYGFGGSGKTALAKNFEKAAKNYCYTIFIGLGIEIPCINSIKNNTIIFIDYAYEYTKSGNERDRIKRFIESCRDSGKKISIWFLERTTLKEHILIEFNIDVSSTKKINLNEEGVNNKTILRQIFEYRLKEYNRANIEKYVQLITNRFDPKYFRPIWATIMSDLLIDDPRNDFENYGSKVKLLEEYWKYRLKRKNFDAFLDQVSDNNGRKEEVRIYKMELTNRAESIMLFCAITSLSIIIDDTNTERVISFERNGKNYVNEELEKLVQNILIMGEKIKTPIRHSLLAQLFPSEVNTDRGSIITINLDVYDIIVSWLLEHAIKNDKNIVNLLQCVSGDLTNHIIAYLTRAYDEDNGKALLWWFTSIYTEFNINENSIGGYEEWLIAWCKLYPDANDELKSYMELTLNEFVTSLEGYKNTYYEVCRFVFELKKQFEIEKCPEYILLLEKLNLKIIEDSSTKIIRKER